MNPVTYGSAKLTFLPRIPCEEPGCPQDPHFMWHEKDYDELLCTQHAQQRVHENILGMFDSLQRGWELGDIKQSPEEAAQLMADYWLAALALLEPHTS